MYHQKVNKKSDIFREQLTNDVVVIGKTGKVIFRQQYSAQTVGIANALYMCEKYGDDFVES